MWCRVVRPTSTHGQKERPGVAFLGGKKARWNGNTERNKQCDNGALGLLWPVAVFSTVYPNRAELMEFDFPHFLG